MSIVTIGFEPIAALYIHIQELSFILDVTNITPIQSDLSPILTRY